jgi:tripartite-type tricarboxylate transporter receptor subunit TctC
MSKLVGEQGTEYDNAKFQWLGSMSSATVVALALKDAPVKKFEDLFTTSLRIASSGPGGYPYTFSNLSNTLLGTKFDIISGYEGSAAFFLAMERGDVQGTMMDWGSVKSTRSDWIKDGRIIVLAQMGLKKHPDLISVPLMTEFTKDERAKSILEVAFSQLDLGRPFLAPPGVPAERVQALRKAFMDTLSDPELKAEAEKSKQELVNPMNGEEAQTLVQKIMATPKDQVDVLAKYLKTQ